MRRESQQDRSTGHVSAGEMGIPSLCVKAILGDLWHGVSGLSEPGICSGKVETRVTQACGGISGTGGGVGSGDLDRNGHVGIVCEGISRDVVSCRPCVESSGCHVCVLLSDVCEGGGLGYPSGGSQNSNPLNRVLESEEVVVVPLEEGRKRLPHALQVVGLVYPVCGSSPNVASSVRAPQEVH